MAHCAQCGAPVEMQRACGSCGHPGPHGAAAAAGRTLLGTHESVAQPSGVPARTPPTKAQHTLLGMPADALPQGLGRAEPAQASPASPAAAGSAPSGSRPAGGTLLGMPHELARDPRELARTAVLGSGAKLPGAQPMPSGAPKGGGRTLLGVAMPGIAPESGGEDEYEDDALEPHAGAYAHDPGAHAPAEELGATLNPPPAMPGIERQGGANHLARRVRLAPAKRAAHPAQPPRSNRRAWLLVAAALVIAAGGLAFALLYKSGPPLAARATTDEDGNEVLEVRCDSCDDGTVIEVFGEEAEIEGGVARVPMKEPLAVGDNPVEIRIDRPAEGRDEDVRLAVQVAYRARPDLTTLQGSEPAILVVVEAMEGVSVELDGKSTSVVGGRAVHTIDVGDAITGVSASGATLKRAVPYRIELPGGEVETGEIKVAVGILPLVIDAPGPAIVIDEETFVLAGRTAKGAEVTAAGKPLAVKPDGSFAQVMNVSSEGATKIEVRASADDRAPRRTYISVRRVRDLAAYAKTEAATEGLVPAAQVLDAPSEAKGESVRVSGKVVEARRRGHQTAILMEADAASGCTPDVDCRVRLLYGAEAAFRSGDTLTVFGTVAGDFLLESGGAVPELYVQFLLGGGS